MFFRIPTDDDFSQMLPQTLAEQIALFSQSPISNKVFVVVFSSDPKQDILEAVDDLKYEIENNSNLGLSAPNLDASFLISYYNFFPNLWNAQSAKEVSNILTPKEIKQRFNQSIDNLFSGLGMFYSGISKNDPLNLLEFFTSKLNVLNFIGQNLQSENNAGDKNYQLLIYDYKDFLNLSKAKALKDFFVNFSKTLPQNLQVFYIGSPRYTSQNDEMIRRDVFWVSIVSIALMILMFIFLLKDKKALFIYFAPLIVIVISAVITQKIFGALSIMTLGFGGVLMGLSVDYLVYIYFAIITSSRKDKFNVVRKMFKPIFASAITSIITFLLLFFSAIGIFKQVAVFCAIGLSLAMLIAFLIAPFIFKGEGGREGKNDILNNVSNKYLSKCLSKRNAKILLTVIFLLAAISLNFLKTNTSLEALNAQSKQLKADRKIFDEITGASFDTNKMLFVFGDTREEALRNNELLSVQNPILTLWTLYPSNHQRQENIENWKQFWSADKILFIKENARSVLDKYGVKANAFNSFYENLLNPQTSANDKNVLENVFNPIVQTQTQFAFVNIISKDVQIKNIPEIKTVEISNALLQEKIAEDVLSRFTKIMIVLLIGSFLVTFCIFGSFKQAFISLLPALTAISVFIIFASLFGVELNLIGLYGLPLLVGLGVDYGIFMIYQNKVGKMLHPTKAVIIAALSTLIGFGSLMCARHSVLFIIGFMVFVGITAAILTTIFVLPALCEDSK
ncbi:MAG: MMPL family transporter [Elusimicrobiota bacterium]|nr:MMPL family transporter [Elusimicrobiota bacterium]